MDWGLAALFCAIDSVLRRVTVVSLDSTGRSDGVALVAGGAGTAEAAILGIFGVCRRMRDLGFDSEAGAADATSTSRRRANGSGMGRVAVARVSEADLLAVDSEVCVRNGVASGSTGRIDFSLFAAADAALAAAAGAVERGFTF